MSVVNQNTLVEGKKDIFSLSLGNRHIYVSVERKKLEKVQIIPPYCTVDKRNSMCISQIEWIGCAVDTFWSSAHFTAQLCVTKSGGYFYHQLCPLTL